MQMFITTLVFFALVSGVFFWLNYSQFKRFKALELSGHDEETTRRFLDWQSAKLSALRWGQLGWVMVFLVGVAVLPWLKTIVPLLAVGMFVVAMIRHDAAAKKMKKLPAHLSQQIQAQQGLFRFAWAVPAVVFGGVALVGLQKVSNMVHPLIAPVMAKKEAAQPAPDKNPAASDPDKAAVVGEAQAGTAPEGADAVPTPTPAADPFAE